MSHSQSRSEHTPIKPVVATSTTPTSYHTLAECPHFPSAPREATVRERDRIHECRWCHSHRDHGGSVYRPADLLRTQGENQ